MLDLAPRNAAADSPMPSARGPLSEFVIGALPAPAGPVPPPPLVDPGDALGDEDLQLALYVCYELHYRSFEGVDPEWEWEPSLLELRRRIERTFLEALVAAVPMRSAVSPQKVGALLFELAEVEADRGSSPSRHMQRRGTLAQFREYLIHRSAYQLKEADPHTWAIPRLHGPPKAAMVEIQADEYGSGAPERVHATLFARTMDAAGLDSAYGAHLDRIPGFSLATVNLISALGLNRGRRGALAGHLAMFEIASPIPSARYASALRRLGFSGDALEFYNEHVEADSVHENIAAYDLAQGLALQQPELVPDILFGAEALLALEGRFASRLLAAWERGESSLLASETVTV